MQHIEMLEGNVIKREENNLPTSYASLTSLWHHVRWSVCRRSVWHFLDRQGSYTDFSSHLSMIVLSSSWLLKLLTFLLFENADWFKEIEFDIYCYGMHTYARIIIERKLPSKIRAPAEFPYFLYIQKKNIQKENILAYS